MSKILNPFLGFSLKTYLLLTESGNLVYKRLFNPNPLFLGLGWLKPVL
jgi:hypothetical protein